MKIKPISGVVQSVIKNLTLRQNAGEQFIFDALLEQLTEQEKKHIRPGGIYEKNLILLADSPGWMYTLNLKKNQILKILQERFNKDEIAGIRLKIG